MKKVLLIISMITFSFNLMALDLSEDKIVEEVPALFNIVLESYKLYRPNESVQNNLVLIEETVGLRKSSDLLLLIDKVMDGKTERNQYVLEAQVLHANEEVLALDCILEVVKNEDSLTYEMHLLTRTIAAVDYTCGLTSEDGIRTPIFTVDLITGFSHQFQL